MLGRDDPPEMIAASFALGVAISFTPLIGFHWIIALALAFLLRLRKIDVLLGTLVVNPLTIVPVSAAAIEVGRFVLHARREAVTHLPWHQLLHREFWEQATPHVRAIGLHWFVGMFVLSFLAGALTYNILATILRRRRDRERTSFLGLH